MSYVQHIFGLRGASAGATLVMPGNTVAGNTVILFSQWSYDGTAPTYSDSQGNTYTARGAQPKPAQNDRGKFHIHTAPVGSSAACTITLAGTGLCRWAVAVEVSGLVASPYDKQSVNSNGANDCTAGSITPATNGQYIMAVFWRDMGATSFAPGAGWTERAEFGSSAPNGCLIDQVQATAAAINATVTAGSVNTSYYVNGFVASFEKAAGGGPEGAARYYYNRMMGV